MQNGTDTFIRVWQFLIRPNIALPSGRAAVIQTNQILCPQKHPYTNICSSFIQSCPELEAIVMSFKGELANKLVCLQTGILFGIEKKTSHQATKKLGGGERRSHLVLTTVNQAGMQWRQKKHPVECGRNADISSNLHCRFKSIKNLLENDLDSEYIP